MTENKPRFDKDIDLFKLQVITEYRTGSHLTHIAGYLGAVVAYGIFLMQFAPNAITYFTALAFGGGFVIITVLYQELIPYRRHVRWLSTQIERVERGEPLPNLEELWKESKKWREENKGKTIKDTGKNPVSFFRERYLRKARKRLPKYWKTFRAFSRSKSSILAYIMLATIVISPISFSQLAGRISAEPIDFALQPFFPLNVNVTKTTIRFDNQQRTVQLQAEWSGLSNPGVFYVSLPFEIISARGYANTNVSFPLNTRGGNSWFVSVNATGWAMDLWLNVSDMITHGFWKDTLSLTFGTSSSPIRYLLGSSFYSVITQSVSLVVTIAFRGDQVLDSGTFPSATHVYYSGTQGFASWVFPRTYFYNSMKLSLITHNPLSVIPPWSIDYQAFVLPLALVMLDYRIRTFQSERKKVVQ